MDSQIKRTPTVGIIVLQENKVLLVKHGETAGHITGTYGAPGGRIDAGESPVEAAVRELKEETGLNVNASDLVQLPKTYEPDLNRKNGEILRVFHTVFTTRKFTGELQGSDETNPEWVDLAAIDTMELLINTKDMIKNAKEFV